MRFLKPMGLLIGVPIVVIGIFEPRLCSGELLYFNGGGRAQVRARVSDGFLRLELPSGPAAFPTGDFLKIVPGGCPEGEWPDRRTAALRGDGDARFAAAWWALENGLVDESVTLLRESHSVFPEHRLTARLVSILDRLDRPRIDPETRSLREALGVPLRSLRGRHVELLHQHDERDAVARVEFLDRVFVAFHLILGAQGFDLREPSHRLVSVYLKAQRDYLVFLNSQHAQAFRSTLGYYHPNFRAVVAYDARSSGKFGAGSIHADQHVAAPGGPLGPSGEAPVTRNSTGPLEAEDGPGNLSPQKFLREIDSIAMDHGTAAHEMVHLLVAETGLEPEPGSFPHWLHEGLAAQFEVVRGGRWAGVGRAHDLRLPDYRISAEEIPIVDLIRDKGFGHGYRRGLYAQSWALVYFLRKTRGREFVAFVDALRVPATFENASDYERIEAAFRKAFGPDLGALDRSWRAYMQDVQTPLEANAPARRAP